MKFIKCIKKVRLLLLISCFMLGFMVTDVLADTVNDGTDVQQVDNNGQIADKPEVQEIEGRKYLIMPDGNRGKGWYDAEGLGRMYFDPEEGNAAVSGLKKIDGAVYYFDDNCVMVRASIIVTEGKKYFLQDNGTAFMGWIQMTDYWRFYFDPEDDGAASVGFKTIDQEEYYFDENGIMQDSGIAVIDGKKYLVTDDGSIYKGWIQLTAAWKFYFDPNDHGAAAVGFQTIGNSEYYFDENGVMQCSGVVTIGGKKYMFLDNGSIYEGWIQLTPAWKFYFDPADGGAAAIGFKVIGNKEYYFDVNGVMQVSGIATVGDAKYMFLDDGSIYKGWIQLTPSWKFYFDPANHGAAMTGFQAIEGKDYYFDNNGVMQQQGSTTIAGKKYLFLSDGSIFKGWIQLTDAWRLYFDPANGGAAATGVYSANGKTYLFDDNGILFREAGTPMFKGKRYWTNADGSLNSGWLSFGNWKLYFKPDSFEGAAGVTEIEGKLYLFNESGNFCTGSGAVDIDGKRYFFNTDGTVKTGWITIGPWTLYYSPTTGAAATGITAIEGKTYLFDGNGIWVTGKGIIDYNGERYCFGDDNVVITGWFSFNGWTLYFDTKTAAAAKGFKSIDGNTYYFDSNAIMRTGLSVINGQQYYFYDTGIMARNAWVTIGGQRYYFGSNGVGSNDLSAIYPGPYKLTIDRTNCVVTAYAKDENGSYTIPVKSMLCSVGLPSTETPSGTYYTSAKFTLKELMGPSWGKWATRIVGGIYFHSVATGSPVDPTHTVPATEFNKLGQPASHGCVRLCVRDAKWIYDHCSLGTQVVIGDNFALPFGIPTLPKITGSVDPTDPDA